MFTDSLITWSAVESYRSENCGGQGLPQSYGLNVHYLRRYDTGSNYDPKPVDPEAPFGFFVLDSGDGPLLTRLPHTGPDFPDGEILYYLDPDFPSHLRHLVEEVFSNWNDTIEEAGANRPFKIMNGGPAIVPWDPRYRVVSWDGTQSLLETFADARRQGHQPWRG